MPLPMLVWLLITLPSGRVGLLSVLALDKSSENSLRRLRTFWALACTSASRLARNSSAHLPTAKGSKPFLQLLPGNQTSSWKSVEEHAWPKEEQFQSSGSPDLICRCSASFFFFECNLQRASENPLEKIRHGPHDCSLEDFLQIHLVQTPQPFYHVQSTQIQRNWSWHRCLLGLF